MEANVESSVGLFTTDVDLNIQIWDAALERMTGIPATQATGRPVFEVIPDLRDRKAVFARFDQALKKGTVEILAPALHKFLIPCQPSFPSIHFAEMRQQVRIAPLLEGEVICGLMVTIEDVTRRMEDEIELAESLQDPDPSVRLDAARALSEADDPLIPETAGPVIEGLDDPDWKVRRNLVESMSHRGGADAIEALLRAMRDKHLSFGVVNSALQILRASSIDTSATLAEFLKSSETDLRMHAALALGEQNDPGVVPHLKSALADDDTNVRYHVIEALGKLRAAETLELLLQVAEARDFFLSFAALDAIAEIGDVSSADRVIPLLQDAGLRDAALRTLGSVGRPSDIASIVQLLDEDERLTVAIADAALALYQRHQLEPQGSDEVLSLARETITPDGLAHLTAALATKENKDVVPLILFSSWFPDRAISERLCSLLSDEELREQVLSGLLMQGPVAVEPLIGCLASENDGVRHYAVRGLGRLGDASAVDALIDVLENGSADDAQTAIDALGSIDDPRSSSVLIECLTDPDARIRESAVRALGRLAKPEFSDAVLATSKDPDETVRHAAIEQIPSIVGQSGLPAVIQALENDTPRVRAAAVRALAQLEHQDSIAPLRKALNDPDAWTRYFAVRGIGSLRDLSSADRLKDIIEKDPAEQVRMAAREVASELGI